MNKKVEKIRHERDEKLEELNNRKKESLYEWIYLNGIAYLMGAKDLQKDIGEHRTDIQKDCDKKIKETKIEYKKKEIDLDYEEED